MAIGPKSPGQGAVSWANLEPLLLVEAKVAAVEKKDKGPYKIEHFCWGSWPRDKHYSSLPPDPFMGKRASLTLSICSYQSGTGPMVARLESGI